MLKFGNLNLSFNFNFASMIKMSKIATTVYKLHCKKSSVYDNNRVVCHYSLLVLHKIIAFNIYARLKLRNGLKSLKVVLKRFYTNKSS